MHMMQEQILFPAGAVIFQCRATGAHEDKLA